MLLYSREESLKVLLASFTGTSRPSRRLLAKSASQCLLFRKKILNPDPGLQAKPALRLLLRKRKKQREHRSLRQSVKVKDESRCLHKFGLIMLRIHRMWKTARRFSRRFLVGFGMIAWLRFSWKIWKLLLWLQKIDLWTF